MTARTLRPLSLAAPGGLRTQARHSSRRGGGREPHGIGPNG